MKKIHVVPHQHFDIVWRRDSQWYVKRRKELYIQALKMLEKYPESTFTLSQAYILREFLDNSPEYIDMTKKFLRDKRLEIIGGLESIPDLNICSGQAIMKNIELGLQWFREKLEYEVNIACFEDAFGVSAQIPQILKLLDFDFYKMSRMPRPDMDDFSGDHRFQAMDGTVMKCIGPLNGNLDWGWGGPDNPDSPETPSYDEKYRKIYSRMKSAVKSEGENILYVVMGEEQDIFDDIALMIPELSEETNAEFKFSTFQNYFDTISEKEWSEKPLIDRNTDISRLFTGCYTTKIGIKQQSRRLEYKLLASEFSNFADKSEKNHDTEWRKLAVSQFHDAICGCHIAENTEYLKKLMNEADRSLENRTAKIPWKPIIPDFHESFTDEKIKKKMDLDIGSYKIAVDNGKIQNIKFKEQNFGPLCKVAAREEHGTMWTEEYNNDNTFINQKNEKLAALKTGKNTIQIETEGQSPFFLDMWPGFADLKWRRTYFFNKFSPFVMILFKIYWLGNSTEISLSWESSELKNVDADIPFGHRKRHSYKPSEDYKTGEAFPSLNWVKSSDYAVFNCGNPAHALRDGKLETILLRSPVKRWSPFFVVTPENDAWDNGYKHFLFLWTPEPSESYAQLHRTGIEFNLTGTIEKADDCTFDDLPENIVVANAYLEKGQRTAVLFEADGTKSESPFGTFNPYEIKKIKF